MASITNLQPHREVEFKDATQHVEFFEIGSGEHGSDDLNPDIKHGDRALAIVGSERIVLTEEDVCAFPVAL